MARHHCDGAMLPDVYVTYALLQHARQATWLDSPAHLRPREQDEKGETELTRQLVTVRVLKLTGVLIASSLVAISGSLPAFSAPRVKADPKWVSYNSSTHVVKLTIIASYAQPTYNFDGASSGALTITVPLHSRIKVTFTNASAMMPHGAEIVKYTGSLPGSPPPAPAFKGATSPNYLHGTQPGDVQHFSFVAGKAGKYLLICPVHNHVSHGHWDWFVVSAKAKTATAVFK